MPFDPQINSGFPLKAQNNGDGTSTLIVLVEGSGGGGNVVIEGSRSAPLPIIAADGIPFSGLQPLTKAYIIGAGSGGAGEVIVTADPRIASGNVDGQILTIQSTSDGAYVELQDGNGLVMNGPWIGQADSSITFSWDLFNWIETGRQ